MQYVVRTVLGRSIYNIFIDIHYLFLFLVAETFVIDNISTAVIVVAVDVDVTRGGWKTHRYSFIRCGNRRGLSMQRFPFNSLEEGMIFQLIITIYTQPVLFFRFL